MLDKLSKNDVPETFTLTLKQRFWNVFVPAGYVRDTCLDFLSCLLNVEISKRTISHIGRVKKHTLKQKSSLMIASLLSNIMPDGFKFIIAPKICGVQRQNKRAY